MCFDAGHANVCGDTPRLSWNEGVRQNRQLGLLFRYRKCTNRTSVHIDVQG